MFLGSRPASGTRIGTATWPYNAQLVEVQPLTPRKSGCGKFRQIGIGKRACVEEYTFYCGARLTWPCHRISPLQMSSGVCLPAP
jgi:hypothetical protein